jgi:hypothetical protein
MTPSFPYLLLRSLIAKHGVSVCVWISKLSPARILAFPFNPLGSGGIAFFFHKSQYYQPTEVLQLTPCVLMGK